MKIEWTEFNQVSYGVGVPVQVNQIVDDFGNLLGYFTGVSPVPAKCFNGAAAFYANGL